MMEFNDPIKRRQHNRLLVVGYVLTGIALILATYLFYNIGLRGYVVNNKTGDVLQNGLMFVAATPSDAAISLDGVEKSKGEARFNIPAGKYKLKIDLNGYKSWENEVQIDPSGLDRIVYPRLFPSVPESTKVSELSDMPVMYSQSPDRKRVVAQLADGSLYLTDLGSATGFLNITLPAGVSSTTTKPGLSTFHAQEWSSDNRHLLVSHELDSGSLEFIIIDIESPDKSLNINQQFLGQNISSVVLRDKKFDKYYLYDSSSGLLSKTDGKAVTSISKNVVSFKPYKDNTLLYVTRLDDKSSTVDLHFLVDDRNVVLRKLPVSDKYLLDIADFEGKLYVVAGGDKDGRNYIYKDIMASSSSGFTTASPHRVLIIDKPTSVAFSTNARFISVQSGSKLAIFDSETEDQFSFDRPADWTGANQGKWMDGYRFVQVDETGNVHVLDFDNTNSQIIYKFSPGTQVFFDPDYEAMFGFLLNGTTGQFTKVSLRVK